MLFADARCQILFANARRQMLFIDARRQMPANYLNGHLFGHKSIYISYIILRRRKTLRNTILCDFPDLGFRAF
jgi:hypothetical protein